MKALVLDAIKLRDSFHRWQDFLWASGNQRPLKIDWTVSDKSR